MQWKEGFSEADTLLALADGSGEEDDIGLGRNIRAMLGADEHVGARGKGPSWRWDMGGKTQNSLTGCHPF